MLRALISKELLAHLLSLKYVTVLLLFLVLSIGATMVRTHVFNRLSADYREARIRRELLQKDHPPGWSAMLMGYYAQKPPNVLSIVAYGLEDELSRTLRFGANRGGRVHSRKIQTPLARINPSFDLLTIVTLVCSLLALVVAFDAVCGERRSGTLPLLLAGPLPRVSIVLAKTVAGLLVLLVPLGIAWLLSILYILVFADAHLASAEWVRLGGIGVLSVAYITLFFGVGMAASTLARRNGTSLAACMAAWALAVLLAPPVLPYLARAVVDAPDRAEVEQAVIREQNEFVARHLEEIRARAAATESPMPLEERVGEQLDQHLQQCNGRQGGRYLEKMGRWHGVAAAVFGLSPATAFTHAATDLAGTGIQSYFGVIADFDETLRTYMGVRWKWLESNDASLLPAFVPPRPSLTDVVGVNLPGMAAMGLLTVLFLMLSFYGFVRRQD